MVVAAYLILPGMWQWNRAAMRAETNGTSRKAIQVDTVSGPGRRALVQPSSRHLRPARSPRRSSSPTTTSATTQSRYTVTPENFAAQMRMIHDAGWTTLTADQLDALAGR